VPSSKINGKRKFKELVVECQPTEKKLCFESIDYYYGEQKLDYSYPMVFNL
jgi:hypothetical protein